MTSTIMWCRPPAWASCIDQRILFIETLFDAFQSSGAHTFTELFEDKARLIADMLRVAASLPKEEQQELRRMLGEFARIGARVLITGAKSGFKR